MQAILHTITAALLFVMITSNAFGLSYSTAPDTLNKPAPAEHPIAPMAGMADEKEVPPITLKSIRNGQDVALVYELPDVRMLSVSVRDAEGKLVRFLQISGQRHGPFWPLGTQDLPPGFYSVRLDADGQRYMLGLEKP